MNINETDFTITVAKKEITPQLSGTVEKPYDGTADIDETLASGLTLTLQDVLPVDTDKVRAEVTYQFDDETIGDDKTITGTITGLTGDAAGNYQLTATEVTGKGSIQKVAVSGISLNAAQLTLNVNGTETLTASIEPENATNKDVTWASSDNTVATVDENGLVTALKEGNAKITVTAADDTAKTAECEVEVVAEGVLSKVTLNQTELSLTEGAQETLAATPFPDGAEYDSMEWTSSNENVAAVDETGKVTAVAKGSAEITVTVTAGERSVTAVCSVTVTESVAAEAVTLNQTGLQLKVSETSVLTATITPENATNQNVTWTSSDETVAAVDETGKVTAVAAGEAVITAAAADGSGVSAECKVTVTDGTEDEPGTDEPGTDEPGTDEPGTDEPGTDEPGSNKPGTDESGSNEPGTDEPGTDEPGTEDGSGAGSGTGTGSGSGSSSGSGSGWIGGSSGSASSGTGTASPGTGTAAPDTGTATPGTGTVTPGTGTTAPDTGNTQTGVPENKVVTNVTERADGTFTDASGEVLKNAIVETADGTKYITDQAGAKITRSVVTASDGTMYCTKADGTVARNQTVTLDGAKYFAKADGAVARNEFCTTSYGNTVYAKADGTLAVNATITVDGSKYFAKKSGAIAKDEFCTTPKGSTVYAKADGTLAVDAVINVGGKKYYAKKSGAIAKKAFSTTPKGSKVYSNANGVIVTNRIFKVNGKRYYAKKSGAVAVKAWVTVGNKQYYCNASGRITKTRNVKR